MKRMMPKRRRGPPFILANSPSHTRSRRNRERSTISSPSKIITEANSKGERVDVIPVFGVANLENFSSACLTMAIVSVLYFALPNCRETKSKKGNALKGHSTRVHLYTGVAHCVKQKINEKKKTQDHFKNSYFCCQTPREYHNAGTVEK